MLATMGMMAALDQARPLSTAPQWSSLALASAATLPADEVLTRLESTTAGLSHDQAHARLAQAGANALRSHGARPTRRHRRRERPRQGTRHAAGSAAADPVNDPHDHRRPPRGWGFAMSRERRQRVDRRLRGPASCAPWRPPPRWNRAPEAVET
jgi:Cation transporter/ATPase, N-terminus